MSYGRYNTTDHRTGCHMLRAPYSARLASASQDISIYALDDGDQSDNFVGTQLRTGNSGELAENITTGMAKPKFVPNHASERRGIQAL